MSKKPATKQTVCGRCQSPSQFIGAASGLCPSCQNEDVASLELELGLPVGELGRVNERGEEI